MDKLPIKLKIFLISIYILFGVTIIYSFNSFGYTIKGFGITEILFFGILMIITESLTVSYRDISVSTSFAVQLSCFMLFGPLFTVLIQIIGFTFRIARNNNKKIHILNTPLFKTFFNYSIVTIPVVIGSLIYYKLGGTTPFSLSPNAFALFAFVLSYFLTETLIISILFSLLYGKNIINAYISNLKMAGLNILAMVPFSLILVFAYKGNNYFGVLLVIFPVLLARYTFQLYIKGKSQYLETITALMHAMEARDKYTEGHSERVSEISLGIAKELKFSEGRLEELRIAAMLHDVGKIGIDDAILNKKDKLTVEEYNAIKRHPEIGENILKDISGMDFAKFIVLHHHERYDGKGYPSKLNFESVNIETFIVGLADSIDAMLTDRPYRKARDMEFIFSELKVNKGTQFHPEVVEAYFGYLKKKEGKNI